MTEQITPTPASDNGRALVPVATGGLDDRSLAVAFVKSRFFADANDENQAIVKIVAGRELGIGPLAAMQSLYIVKGRVMLSANVLAALVRRSGRYDYRVLKLTPEECEIAFYQSGQEIGRSAFSLADARRAGTQNVDKYPRNMLFARAMSNGVRWYCPDVTIAPVYVPGEIEGSDNIDSAPTSAPAVAPTSAPSSSPGAVVIDAPPSDPYPPKRASDPATRRARLADRFSQLWATAVEIGAEKTAPITPQTTEAELEERGRALRANIVTRGREIIAARQMDPAAFPSPDEQFNAFATAVARAMNEDDSPV